MQSYKKRWWWLGLAMGAGAFYWYIWIWNPLPSDEEMIEHFQTNRADFEEAVRRYREYPVVPGKDSSLWYKEGDTLEVFKRAGIFRIEEAKGIIWLPNPYSVETAIRVRAMRESNWLAPVRRYKALTLSPTKQRLEDQSLARDHDFRRVSLIWGSYWKSYGYFPEAPRIDGDQLIWAYQVVGKDFVDSQFHEGVGVATSASKNRVLPSLNRIPSNWNRGQCIYRQIEAQWFLKMCNG